MDIKAPPRVQQILVGSDPKRFFKPPYVGHKGWVGVRIDVEVEWDKLAAILSDGYLMTVPKQLAQRPRPKRGDARDAKGARSLRRDARS